jgi:ribose transport system permease protein
VPDTEAIDENRVSGSSVPTSSPSVEVPVSEPDEETVGHLKLRVVGVLLVLLRLGPVLILGVLVLVMSNLSPVFATTQNLGNVLSQTAVIAILAIGQLMVILTRGIDLSVGSTLALSAVVGATVFGSTNGGALT